MPPTELQVLYVCSVCTVNVCARLKSSEADSEGDMKVQHTFNWVTGALLPGELNCLYDVDEVIKEHYFVCMNKGSCRPLYYSKELQP